MDHMGDIDINQNSGIFNTCPNHYNCGMGVEEPTVEEEE